MACPRTLYVAASAVAGFGSAVWVSAIGSLVVHVVLVPATAVVAILIAAAGALLVADWRADLESRQAWAELAPRVAEWNEAMGCEAVDPSIQPICPPWIAMRSGGSFEAIGRWSLWHRSRPSRKRARGAQRRATCRTRRQRPHAAARAAPLRWQEAVGSVGQGRTQRPLS
jgi:hypothetical protein